MSIFDGMGYVFSDDRASGGKLVQTDLIGCVHCHASIDKKQWLARDQLRCISCDGALCEVCGAKPPSLKCVGPFELQLERILTDAHRKEQNAKLLGI